MIRIILYLIVVLAIAAGLDWLADRPGTVVVEWQGYVAETSVFRASIMLLLLIGAALLAWSALRWLWSSPATVGRMEAALKDGRLAEVLANAKKLPPKAALAGEDWVRKVQARQAVEQALADVEAALKASLGSGPAAATDGRR